MRHHSYESSLLFAVPALGHTSTTHAPLPYLGEIDLIAISEIFIARNKSCNMAFHKMTTGGARRANVFLFKSLMSDEKWDM